MANTPIKQPQGANKAKQVNGMKTPCKFKCAHHKS